MKASAWGENLGLGLMVLFSMVYMWGLLGLNAWIMSAGLGGFGLGMGTFGLSYGYEKIRAKVRERRSGNDQSNAG